MCTHWRAALTYTHTDTNTHRSKLARRGVSSPLEAGHLRESKRPVEFEGRETAETDAQERSLEEARDRVGDTRQEEEEVVEDGGEGSTTISQQRDGGVCRNGALVGGEVDREVLFLLVVLRWRRPPLEPWSIPILQASHVPVGAIDIASFPALVKMVLLT